MLLGSSRPYPLLILEESGLWADDDDGILHEIQNNYKIPLLIIEIVFISFFFWKKF